MGDSQKRQAAMEEEPISPAQSATDPVLRAFVAKRIRKMVELAGMAASGALYARPLAGALNAEACSAEELLDSYGARTSHEWFAIRQLVAALKNTTHISYIMMHIAHRIPAYHLGTEANRFAEESNLAISIASGCVRRVCSSLLNQVRKLALYTENAGDCCTVLDEDFVPGAFPHDLGGGGKAQEREAVVKLATTFLNMAGEFIRFRPPESKAPEDLSDYVRRNASEEDLRIMELRAHNLQSLYDTYIQDTPAECIDIELVTLRGHATVVFHLLEISTILAHHYQRHLHQSGSAILRMETCIRPDECLQLLVRYSLRYCQHFMEQGARICRAMLRRYSKPARARIPLPIYRGFHVRPSALVAQIVLHYGCEVIMELEGESYNAQSPLDLFRANEIINRLKRAALAKKIDTLMGGMANSPQQEYTKALRHIILSLAEQGDVVIYGTLEMDEEKPASNGKHEEITATEYLVNQIFRLMALGKIDLYAEFHAEFVGDERAVKDIEILARNGYGEDRFGKNIPLPPALSYLHRE